MEQRHQALRGRELDQLHAEIPSAALFKLHELSFVEARRGSSAGLSSCHLLGPEAGPRHEAGAGLRPSRGLVGPCRA